MKKWKLTLNLFALVFYGMAFILMAKGIVSPWVVLLIIMSNVELNITFGGKT